MSPYAHEAVQEMPSDQLGGPMGSSRWLMDGVGVLEQDCGSYYGVGRREQAPETAVRQERVGGRGPPLETGG